MKIKLFGTKIQISFLFLAIASIVIFTDKTTLALPMLIAVILHETAHLVIMKAIGIQPKEVLLLPAQITIIRDISVSNKKEVLISLAGPFCNIVLFVVFYRIKPEFAVINLLFGLFNLLPVNGLDGGEILAHFIAKAFNQNAAELTLKIINMVIGAVGIFIGITLIFRGKLNFSLIIISIYFLLSAIVKL